LLAKGYAVAVLNPLRTRRFAEEELQRTKTDAIDALGIARFAAQKRPPAMHLPDVATEELRELSRLRDRLQQDFASRLRQLHRAVDLGFPEFTRIVHTLESQLATAISIALSNCGVVSWCFGEEVRSDGLRRVAQDRGRTCAHFD
jgi:transposase